MRKSRLVIKGYRQKEGIDYYETFAAVSRMDSVRSIVASSVLKGWKLHQFDAVTPFFMAMRILRSIWNFQKALKKKDTFADCDAMA
jgi:hypothetical protein